MAEEKSGIGTFGNILTIIAFVIIITIGLWGAINAVRLAPRIFTSIRNSIVGAPSISLSAPAQLNSNDPFTLSWKDQSRTKGLYTITYICTPNFTMGIRTGTTTQSLPCGEPFAVSAAQSSATLVPTLTSGTSATVPLSIVYIADNGEQSAAGKTTLSVSKTALAQTSATPTPAKKTLASAPAKPAGKPDLVITPVAIGVVDQYTGQFIPKTLFGSYETVTVKFDIANRGAGPSGSWYFTANLPANTPMPYQSPVQRSLGVGDHTQFMLNFSAPVSGVININVDPANSVAETDESNNSLSQYISVVY